MAYRVTDSLCDFSTNVSQEAVEAFIAQGAVPEGRMVAMHNGIDTERFRFNPYARIRLRNSLGISNSVKVVLAVGRLTAAKDYQNLLCAFSQLEKKYNNTCLVIIGAGEELVKLTSIVDGIGISTKVHFLGMRRDVHDWMSAADLFVLSSAWEGFGLVVAEAMACERVVVATDCGGVKEVIGDVGILVPPKDSTALAKGLVQGLELRTEESCARGRLARQRVNECYSLSAQASRWLALYK